ncbi:NUDIX domain-containing protein [Candidatus Vallotia lariciata]|uniref:NUDIX domain-containing protein n=1 Tax=Candidatus Vallotia laricis TaxID=2018052 RepID=UPI001D024769|nr:NUDIX domain-containing protein [Candidatus Vallotia lariciata]UDG82801.1 RNA pyrophosphohydrolase [Candidatus Vallotia lariciata]
MTITSSHTDGQSAVSQVYSSTNTLHKRKVTETAVGIILNKNNHFLLTRRPSGKPYEGYWEFPGGKLKLGESVEDALARELYEELGITITNSVRCRVLEYNYPHIYARLFFCKIIEWNGDLHSREGQEFIWQAPPVNITPLLPGVLTMIDWLVAKQI